MLELNKIYNMDCLEGLKLLDDNSVDIVVTSPPYNKCEGKNAGKLVSAVVYDTFKDALPEDVYQEQQVSLLSELSRVLKRDGHIFYNHKNRYINGKMVSPLQWIEKSPLEVRQEIIWNRGIAANIRGWRFWGVDERVYWLQKDNANRSELPPNIASMSSIWNIRPQPKKATGHPCCFPVELASRCVSVIGTRDALVLDPYMGSGTTAVAARDAGLNYIGFELSEQYIQIANSRLSDGAVATGDTLEHADGNNISVTSILDEF